MCFVEMVTDESSLLVIDGRVRDFALVCLESSHAQLDHALQQVNCLLTSKPSRVDPGLLWGGCVA